MEAIRVVVRVRPAISDSSESAVRLPVHNSTKGANKVIAIVPPPSRGAASEIGIGSPRTPTTEAQEYRFDRVFGPEAQQEEVYSVVSPLVDAALNGYMATVFAYGPTGSGKTYTIAGENSAPGIMPRAVTQLFDSINISAAQAESLAFMVFLSYTEVYNDNFFDLLSPHHNARNGGGGRGAGGGGGGGGGGSRVQLRDSAARGAYLTGSPSLRQPVTTADQVLGLIAQGNTNRATGATNLNEHSSRSHAIVTLDIECHDSSGDGMIRMGRLNMIDLAGSERVGLSGAAGQRLTEAQNINLSLSVLGDVLSALSRHHRQGRRDSTATPTSTPSPTPSGLFPDGAAPPAGGGGGGGGSASPPPPPFVPFRNSKLTLFLRDSLGGNGKTLMIANVHPRMDYHTQTMVSLRYAARARHIKNRPRALVELQDPGAGDGRGGRGGRGPRGRGEDDGVGRTLTGTLSEMNLLRGRLLERNREFEAMRATSAVGEAERQKLAARLREMEARNRAEKLELEGHLKQVITSQRGELGRQKATYDSLQRHMATYNKTVEAQRATIATLTGAAAQSVAREAATYAEARLADEKS